MTVAGMALKFSWSDHGPSFRFDVMSLVVALAIHAPLYFMQFDMRKKITEEKNKDRLVAIDLLDSEAPTPPPVAAAPMPAPKGPSLMDKLKMMVKNEPPPPPPLKLDPKLPDKLDAGPKQIKIEPKLDLAQKIEPKIQGKSGFQTTADPKLVEEKQISLKSLGAGIAPITASKVGTLTDNKAPLKSDKGNFSLAKGESIRSIGGGSAILADASAPAIAIRTGGAVGSKEQFSAAPLIKSDKGKLGQMASTGLGGGDERMGLRDSIIARDAGTGQIDLGGGSKHGVAGGVPGGVPGGVVGAKKDAGRSFQGGQLDGAVGGTGSGPGSVLSSGGGGTKPSISAPRAAQKKSMFSITGPLSDRKILHQEMPTYPSWAQAQGIEASVVLEFTVDPEGGVKDTIVVRRTTGYPQLDQSAMKALKKWKFVPLQGDTVRDEIGMITFNYSLS